MIGFFVPLFVFVTVCALALAVVIYAVGRSDSAWRYDNPLWPGLSWFYELGYTHGERAAQLRRERRRDGADRETINRKKYNR